ncbi:MAG TPA: vWA domain-containing protein [Polyangiaceae bacterium]|nr:vWA domain-containing protein [Polyangiaceae bacterium]
MHAFYHAAICVSAVGACGVVTACGSETRPPLASSGDGSTSTGSAGAGGLDIDPDPCAGPPPPEAAGFCGNEVFQVLTEKPSVYFVLDGSGSMRDPFERSTTSKLLSAKYALRDLLIEIGHRIRYGAAVFPDDSAGSDVCALGTQVFPVTEGDLPLCAEDEYGPVLARFLDSIGFRQAEGGSPIAATIAALKPTLLALRPRPALVLITDGAPNCNPRARCGPDACIPNLERQSFNGEVCGEDLDCCDPALLGPGAEANCIDDSQSERVLEDLAALGVPSYVVGMPGSESYASVLDRLAAAGGTAREGAETSYYSVRDAADLVGSLASIGSQVSLDCSIGLESAPPDPDLMNVYFDNDPVDFDPENGWSFAGDALIQLNGDACDVLLSGGVNQLQVVAGCPTIIK